MNITDRTSRQPRRRSGRLIVWVIIAVLIGWLLLMVRWLVFPTAISSANSIQNVDAVYVLGEATPERLAKGIAMIETGASDHLEIGRASCRERVGISVSERDSE